ncbi:MAG: hypothetical protein IJI30_08110 [Lachnospiraceae bacterium]|nr:hypothetical protein [Lachnospiraceae bacterium]
MKKRVLAICLVLVMAASCLMAGCAKKLTAKDVAGTYTCTRDCRSYINDGLKEGLEESLGEDKEVDFEFQSEIPGDFVLTLREDETFDLEINVESFADTFSAVFEKEGRDFILAIVKAMGVDESMVTDEQIEQLMDQMRTSLEESFAGADMKEKASTSGTFTLDGTTIKLEADGTKDTGSIDGDTITFKKSLFEDIGGDDWVFTKK